MSARTRERARNAVADARHVSKKVLDALAVQDGDLGAKPRLLLVAESLAGVCDAVDILADECEALERVSNLRARE